MNKEEHAKWLSEYLIGNKQAQKYSEETLAEKYIPALQSAIDNNLSVYTVEGICRLAELPIKVIPYWKKIFKDNSLVLNSIKNIEQQIEERIVTNTQSGDAKSAAMSIFLLKNKHGYVDKVETVNTNTNKISVDFNED